MNSLIPDCTSKCQSLKHALDVLSVVTKGSENQIKAFLSSHCYNATTIKDAFGRNALHLVSSCGKKGVLDWLIEKGVDLLVKDKESGWTALHRSIFYGHIDCVWSLLKHGVSLYIQDKEGLSALDLVMKDRPTHVVFKNTDPTDVYTWGDNTNFTLGHGSQNSKHHPELVDLFSRSGVYIKQIPRLVEGLSGHNCSQVAAAKDHTVVLTEDGCVYTFGLNIFHQLGIIPPPSSCNVPRQMQAKYLKGRTVIGVAAGRFHTVLWTREAVYTLGLNGGQLGYLLDPNGEKCVTAPRQVSALHHKDITLSLVAASDGATVCVTTRGDIYLLADYQCKKMASKQLNLKKVLVSGGCMEYKVDPEHLKENGGQNICILAMDGAGRVFCWRSASSSLKQCRWAYPRQVFISDIALSRNEILFVTQDGEGFRGKWFEEKRKSSEKKDILSNLHNSSSDVSCVSDINSVYERIRLEKLTFAHRAVSVSTDPSGCNFAILQSDPKTSLYEIPSVSSSSFFEEFGKLLRGTDEMDSIHDVTFQVGNRIFPAHKYILAVHSEFFQKLFLSDGTTAEFTDVYRKDEDSTGCHLFVVEKVHPDLFEYILQFIYTDTCDFLTHGFKPRIHVNKKPEEYQSTLNSHLNKMNCCEDDNKKSTFEVNKNNQAHTFSERQKSKPKSCKKGKSVGEDDPVRMLQNVAKKFGFSNLSSRLDGVRFENEKINVIAKKTGDTLKNVSLTTWEIVNKPDILASSCAALEMPIHSDILKVILDYLYTDEAVVIKDNVFILKYILILHLDSNKFKMYENKHLKLSKSLLYTSGKTNSVESLPELLTSDSEGSYAGLGSPRDLQSPDFTTGFHSDKIEGKVKPYVNGIPPTYSKEDLKPWEKSPILKISAPQLIPSNKIDTTSSSSWVAGSFSPVSPPVVDLRTIMEIEESRQKCGATPKSNLGKMISHGVKLSQKQRKMIALTTKENSGMNIMEAVLTTPSKAPKPVNAWASSLHSVSSKSFRDFLVEEKKSMTGHSSGDHVKKVCFKGIESSQTPKVVRCSARGTPGPEGNHISDLPLLDSPNPWLSSSVTAPSVVAPVTFASIVEEELQQEAALIRSREKPLALIQIEEHAIQDLLVFYEAFGNPDEFVIVERTPQGPLAVPMWNKHGC
uniref:Inhibitor of Bruton tyrosine kinase n=1 Tax=Propithecus coquereli TaxID=379532 RepID=A0A2K6GZK0_PROCO